jgi:hypothetical protein
MFENAQELMAALDGHYGQEAEEDALDFAEETGLLAQWEAEDDGAGNEKFVQEFGEELKRLERTIGRSLTQTETDSLINGVSTQDLLDQRVPDLTAEFGPMLSSFNNTQDGRTYLAASAAQQVFDEQGHDSHDALGEQLDRAYLAADDGAGAAD